MTASAPAASAVRRIVPTIARVARLDQGGHEPRGSSQDISQGDVDAPAHRDHTLGGDRLGEGVRGGWTDLVDADRGGAQPPVSGQRCRRGEHLDDRVGVLQRRLHGGRPLGQKAPGSAAGGARGQPACRGQAGVAVREQGTGGQAAGDWVPAPPTPSAATASLATVDERGECGRVVDGEVGEDLAVDVHTGQAQPLDEPVVRHVVGAGRGVDAGDPELAEVALTCLAVAVCVVGGVQQLLLGLAVEAGALAPVAGGSFERGAALLVCVDCALDAGHGSSFVSGPPDGRGLECAAVRDPGAS